MNSWVSSMELEWDPERYDRLSDFRIFAVTWCLWDWTEFSSVRAFSFLEVVDIRSFCCTTYCIYLDFTDILEEIERSERSLRNGGR